MRVARLHGRLTSATAIAHELIDTDSQFLNCYNTSTNRVVGEGAHQQQLANTVDRAVRRRRCGLPPPLL